MITDEEKAIEIAANRAVVNDIIKYIRNTFSYCAYISCKECPMNIAIGTEITCLSNIKIVR